MGLEDNTTVRGQNDMKNNPTRLNQISNDPAIVGEKSTKNMDTKIRVESFNDYHIKCKENI